VSDLCSELAPLYAERALGVLEEDGARLDAHLGECARCGELVKFLAQARAGGALEPVTAPDGIREKVLERAAAEDAAQEAVKKLLPAITVLRSCIYCHGALARHEVVYCSACLAQHHADCFAEHGRCGAPGCGETRVLQPTRLPPKRRTSVVLGAALLALGVGGVAAMSTLVDKSPQPAKSSARPADLGTITTSTVAVPPPWGVRVKRNGGTILLADGHGRFHALVTQGYRYEVHKPPLLQLQQQVWDGRSWTTSGTSKGLFLEPEKGLVHTEAFDVKFVEWDAFRGDDTAAGLEVRPALETLVCVVSEALDTVDPSNPRWEYHNEQGEVWYAPRKAVVEKPRALKAVTSDPISEEKVVAVAFARDDEAAIVADGKGIYRFDLLTDQKSLLWKPAEFDLIWDVAIAPSGSSALVGTLQKLRLVDFGTEGGRVIAGDMHDPVAMSADGKRALTSTLGRDFSLWDLETGKMLRILTTELVATFVIARDGRHALERSQEGVLRLWDLDRGAQLAALPGTGPVGPQNVRNFAFSHDGGRFLAALEDGRLELHEADTGSLLREVPGRFGDATAVALSPDGTRALVAGGKRRAIDLVDLTRGETVKTLFGHDADVRALAFSPDGRRALSGSRDGFVKLWDLGSGKGRTLRGSEPIRGLAVSPDGKLVAAASDHEGVRIFEAETGQLVQTCVSKHPLQLLAFAPDGHQVAAGSSDGTIKIIDIASGNEGLCDSIPSRLLSLTFDADAGIRGVVEFPETVAHIYRSRFEFPTDEKNKQLNMDRAGRHISSPLTAVSNFDEAGDAAIGRANGLILHSGADREELGWPPRALALSRDGNLLAASDGQTRLALFSYKTHLHEDWKEVAATHLAFTPNADRLVICDKYGWLKVLRLDRTQDLCVDLTDEPTALCVASDGTFAVVGTTHGAIRRIPLTR
jgi:WD40 repeat protein